MSDMSDTRALIYNPSCCRVLHALTGSGIVTHTVDSPDWTQISSADPDLRQPLAASQMRLCFADLDGYALESMDLDCLDEVEQKRAATISHSVQRNRYLLSRCLLRQQLSALTGVAAKSLQLEILSHGKPVLRDIGGPFFNLAHTGPFWLLGMAMGHALGVDLERIRPLTDLQRLAKRVFSEEEQAELAEIKDVSDQQVAFFRGWTRKEAVLKALGTGFTLPARSLHIGLGTASRAWCEVAEGERLLVYSGVTDEGLLWAIASHNDAISLQTLRLVTHPASVE
jgi:4'-phosphopantetheinyl transferase